MPALTNLAELRHASAFAGVDRQRILNDEMSPGEGGRELGCSGPTAGGIWRRHGATVASLALEFDRHLAPSIRQPHTRADYWRAWRLVVTWGVARKAMGAVLPMSLTTLKALTWDLVCFAVPTSQVELVWKAVQARHRWFHLPPPMCEANQFSLWSKMLGSIRGRSVALKLPIQKATVRWLLVLRPDSLAAHRARLLSDGGGHPGLLAGQRGREAASVQPVVRLPHVSMASDVASQGGGAGPGRDRHRRARSAVRAGWRGGPSPGTASGHRGQARKPRAAGPRRPRLKGKGSLI
jgi:hypothetical protein